MNIHIKTTGFTLTPAIENYLAKRLKNIKKLLGYTKGKRDVWVELEKITKHHHKGNFFEASIDIALKKRTIHAEERGEGLYEAIDKMESRIIRELKHYKDKFIAKEKRQARVWKKLMRLSPFAFTRKKGVRDREEGI